MACLHNKEPIGMSGVDLHMEDLVQDITYFNQADNSYAFIINNDGTSPVMSCTIFLLKSVNSWKLEQVYSASQLKLNML